MVHERKISGHINYHNYFLHTEKMSCKYLGTAIAVVLNRDTGLENALVVTRLLIFASYNSGIWSHHKT